MNTVKPKLNLIIDEAALQAFTPDINADDAVKALLEHLERHFLAQVTWLKESADMDALSLGKDSVVITNRPNLIELARQNDAKLVTVNNDIKGVSFNMATADDLAFLQKLLTPLNSGKIPNELLGSFLGEIHFDDPDLLINPGIGEDTAAIDIAEAAIMVLKSDPITFASNSISQYAVLVNANDIATAGAKPRWFMTTLLFPRHTTGLVIRHIILELSLYCQKWDICLCGGHTEITDAVTRPVVIGMMCGTLPKEKLLNKKDIKAGHHMILTKAVAVEGTALIAKEMAPQLMAAGMPADEIRRCARFLDMISILPEAIISVNHPGVVAMHDVTEGGLATAAGEMAIAAGLGLDVDIDNIPVFPETQTICDILGINPLGLISSGCLLIACEPETSADLLEKLTRNDIKATRIATFTNTGVIKTLNENKAWPQFEVDEIARITQS